MPACLSSRSSTARAAATSSAPAIDEAGVGERGHAGCERHAVDVERLLHDVEQARDLGVADRVAEPQAGEPEELRERAHDDQGPAGRARPARGRSASAGSAKSM